MMLPLELGGSTRLSQSPNRYPGRYGDQSSMPRRNTHTWSILLTYKKVDELARGFGPALLFAMLKLLSDRAK